METIRSNDGTLIAYQRSGSGPPLVLVHGTVASHRRWEPVRVALAEQFTVYAVDRRGRGESSDASDYALEREFEDIAAVVDSIGAGVNLLGHSYGALCALEAALLTPNLRSLILYEPPISVGGVSINPDGIVERLEALLDAGDHAGVVTTFLREVVKMPPHELEIFTSLPVFPARVAAAHTLPRELRDQESYRLAGGKFQHLTVPTLLLLGGDSPRFFRTAIEAVHAVLPNSRVVELSGQQHIAIDTAPELFVREVRSFLLNQV